MREIGEPLNRGTALRMLTVQLDNPTGYGRVVRKGKKGGVLKIVEQKDTTQKENAIQEVAMSVYTFNGQFLRSNLKKLSTKNAQGEYYLTDLIARAVQEKKKIDVLAWEQSEDLMGINSPWQLAEAAKVMNRRILKSWAEAGVRFQDPDTTWVSSSVELSEDVQVAAGVHLRGETQIGPRTTIAVGSVLDGMTVGADVEIKVGCVCDQSVVQDGAKLGPYAHLRPHSVVGQASKIGNFVELKKSVIGKETSIAHLSYVGDAEVGDRCNIGCGFITCNFDGRVIFRRQHHYNHVLVDHSDRAMLKFSGRITLRMNIGDLFQFQGTFQCEGE